MVNSYRTLTWPPAEQRKDVFETAPRDDGGNIHPYRLVLFRGTFDMSYVGRFAPSPSGDLHFGSLVAAVASYLQAKTLNGKWLVRIEDIDPPREVPGSAVAILSELKRLGMKPDGEVLFQSSRLDSYRRAWEKLLNAGQAFFCGCSRSMLPKDGIHRGHCRDGSDPCPSVKRIRFLVDNRTIRFKDRIMGRFEQVLSTQVGDFVIRRPEGWPAYHLAVVIDDAYQEITEIVRGSDLLDSTPRQLALQRALGLPQPEYCHLPIAVGPDGSKLSKRERSDPVSAFPAAGAIWQALDFLGQCPPEHLPLEQLWCWAIDHWNISRIPQRATLPAIHIP